MEILPAWMIEELERLRKEQQVERPQLRIEIPLPTPDRRHEVRQDEGAEMTIIPLYDL